MGLDTTASGGGLAYPSQRLQIFVGGSSYSLFPKAGVIAGLGLEAGRIASVRAIAIIHNAVADLWEREGRTRSS